MNGGGVWLPFVHKVLFDFCCANDYHLTGLPSSSRADSHYVENLLSSKVNKYSFDQSVVIRLLLPLAEALLGRHGGVIVA